MRNFKKILALGLSTVILTGMLSACGRGGENNRKETESAPSNNAVGEVATTAAVPDSWDSEPVTIRFVMCDDKSTLYGSKLAEEFMRLHPNITLELIDITSNDYPDKLTTMLTGGEDVDVVYIKGAQQYVTGMANEWFEDVMPYVTRDGVDMAPYQASVDQMTVDGKLYGLPVKNDVWALFYNKDLFDEMGEPYPTDDMTWDDWADMCVNMTSGSDSDKVYGGFLQNWPASVQNMAICDGSHTVVESDYEFMRPAYERVLKLQDNGNIIDYSTIQTMNLHYTGCFYNQQVASVYQGSWFIMRLLKEMRDGGVDFNWGVVKAPHNAEGGKSGETVGAAFPLGVNVNSKNKEVAWQFVKYAASVEGAKVVASTGTVPAIFTDEVKEIFMTQEGLPSGATEALDADKVVFELPIDVKSSEVSTVINEEHSLIMTNSVSLDEGLKELTDRVNEILAN